MLAARVENDGYVADRRRAPSRDPGLARRARAPGAAAGPPHHPARQPGGRVRLAHRPPPARRRDRATPPGQRGPRGRKRPSGGGRSIARSRHAEAGHRLPPRSLATRPQPHAAIFAAISALPGPASRLLPPAGAGLLGLRLSDAAGDRARASPSGIGRRRRSRSTWSRAPAALDDQGGISKRTTPRSTEQKSRHAAAERPCRSRFTRRRRQRSSSG